LLLEFGSEFLDSSKLFGDPPEDLEQISLGFTINSNLSLTTIVFSFAVMPLGAVLLLLSVQRAMVRFVIQCLQGRTSEHLVFAALHGKQAIEVLLLFATNRSFPITGFDTPDVALSMSMSVKSGQLRTRR
jgi:hypothetical protein